MAKHVEDEVVRYRPEGVLQVQEGYKDRELKKQSPAFSSREFRAKKCSMVPLTPGVVSAILLFRHYITLFFFVCIFLLWFTITQL